MKKIILCGKSCTGKTTLKQHLVSLGYLPGISYTTRKKRDHEVEGLDYHFIKQEDFISNIYSFFEWDQIGDAYYGTHIDDFHKSNVFIFTPKAIKNMSREDRRKSLVIYLESPLESRVKRAILRGDSYESIVDRIPKDCHTFSEFTDFDIKLELHSKDSVMDFINLLGRVS